MLYWLEKNNNKNLIGPTIFSSCLWFLSWRCILCCAQQSAFEEKTRKPFLVFLEARAIVEKAVDVSLCRIFKALGREGRGAGKSRFLLCTGFRFLK